MGERNSNKGGLSASAEVGRPTGVGSRRSRRGPTRACRSPVGPNPSCLTPSCPSRGSQCRCSWVRESILQSGESISMCHHPATLDNKRSSTNFRPHLEVGSSLSVVVKMGSIVLVTNLRNGQVSTSS